MTLRSSSYTIFVDIPDQPESLMLVHGYSGAFDVVPRRVGEYLRANSKTVKHVPRYGTWSDDDRPAGDTTVPSDRTLDVLARRGYLTELTQDQERERLREVADTIHTRRSRDLVQVVMPSYDCNLRCFYCFQDHMRRDAEQSPLLKPMTHAMADRILLATQDIERRAQFEEGVNARSLGLFGGEPLTELTESVVRRLVAGWRDRTGADVWAISNGTDLPRFEDLLGPDGISWIQITLDGPPRLHDTRRIRTDGSGSFAEIADGIDLALARGAAVNVRMNVDRTNFDLLPELADVMHDRGWPTSPLFSAGVAPIHGGSDLIDPHSLFSPRQLNRALDEARTRFGSLRVLERPDDPLVELLHSVLATGGDPPLVSEFCSAHTGMHVFDAFGDVYACWEKTGDPKLRIGSVDRSGSFVEETKTLRLWRDRTVSLNDTCSGCRFALWCGGGCASQAENKTGSIGTNLCEGYASRFRTAAGEALGKHQRGIAPRRQQVSICG